MQVNSLRSAILLLLGATIVQLQAQQSAADRTKLGELRASAETGDAQSQSQLAEAFFFGNLGVAEDYGEAVKWWRKAAEQNHALAQRALGECYDYGKGVTKDEVEAMVWYRKAAEQGLAAAQHNVGVFYEDGKAVAKDELEAVKWYRKAAERNLAASQLNLGFCYAAGKGVTKDEVEAVNWFRKAAAQNEPVAQFNLGLCYASGRGVATNEVEAAKWYRMAAEQNDAMAQFNLGFCYRYGRGVVKDKDVAVKWFRKAAEQGYASAQYNLAMYHSSGDGVGKDEVEAVKWYRKAADQGLAIAQTSLGVCYQKGIGVPRIDVEAAKWYRKAADQNDAIAQNNLGLLYSKGEGVVKDEVEGYKWFLLAAGHGEDSAKENVVVSESRLTRGQIAEGQKLARDFKPREVPSTSGNSSRSSLAQTRPESSGTGFFITADGYLITNEHVVRDAMQVRLVTSMGLISGKVVKVDAANDLALLKAEGRFEALPLAASRGVKLGGTVGTVGFPNIGLQGFAPKLAKGEIASLSGAQDDARYFQISLPVQPGNSGGALVDERGNVVGVVSAKLSARAALSATGALPENVNYAVKSSYLLGFLESVPEVSARLKEPNMKERKFEDVVKDAEQAAVLVLVY